MASLRSLGIHTPTALPHLVAESILPENAPASAYRWEIYDDVLDGSQASQEEELLITDHCVAYSKAGIVQKVFNFKVEEEKILDAVLTSFSTPDTAAPGSKASSSTPKASGPHAYDMRKHSTLANKNRTVNDGQQLYKSTKLSRALVVFLKSQAHVFFLSGPTHIVNLPFEVEKAFPSPRGLVIQRKIVPEPVAPTPLLPSVPQNSFISFSQSWSQQPQLKLDASFLRVPTTLPGASASSNGPVPSDLLKSVFNQNPSDALPRLFSFTDPLSEFGLVVNGDSSQKRSSLMSRNGWGDLESIDKGEELIYVSARNEMAFRKESSDRPLMLVVTLNRKLRLYSVWYAAYLDAKSASSKPLARLSSVTGSKSRRRSSFANTPGPGTGATTPAIRARDGVRESFGAAGWNKATQPSQVKDQSQQTAEETFASQLDPEFDIQNQPTRDPRRVSSLLSRAELSTSFDKNAFQDLATQHSNVGASFGPTSRRGHSLGTYPDRLSFGGSHNRLRASTPGGMSRLSFGAASVDETMEDVMDYNDTSQLDDFDTLEEILSGEGGRNGVLASLHEPLDGLRKELILVKLTELPMGADTDSKVPIKVFTMPAPWPNGSSSRIRFLYLHIFNPGSNDHVELELSVHRKPLPSRASNRHGRKDLEPRYAIVPCGAKSQSLSCEIDAIKIEEGGIQRVVSLRKDALGAPTFSLYSGWSQRVYPRFSLDKVRLSNPYSIENGLAMELPSSRSEDLVAAPQSFRRLVSPVRNGSFDAIDDQGQRHRLRMQLCPEDTRVSRLLHLVQIALPKHHGDILLTSWWHARQLLHKHMIYNNDWSAFVVMLFTLAVPFLKDSSVGSRPTARVRMSSKRAMKATAPEPSSTMPQEESAWDSMWAHYRLQPGFTSLENTAWGWAKDLVLSNNDNGTKSNNNETRNSFIPTCVSHARKFYESPIGRALNDDWRRLSTTETHDLRCIYLPRLIAALHLYREESKLHLITPISSDLAVGNLALVIAQLSHWFGWEHWGCGTGGYYDLDGASRDEWLFDQGSFGPGEAQIPPWESPPSVYEWIGNAAGSGSDQGFPTLELLIRQSASHTISEETQQLFTDLTPRTIALTKFFNKNINVQNDPVGAVELMSQIGIDSRMLETMPPAVVAPLKEAIIRCQASPPTSWSNTLLKLVGREDLQVDQQRDKRLGYHIVNVRDLLQQEKRRLINPNMQVHMLSHPPTRDIHTIGLAVENFEPALSSYEIDQYMVTRLIFNEDRRFTDAVKLLEPIRQAVAECQPDPQWTEAQYLDEQKKVVQWVMLRTFALPAGNAMIKLNFRRPLLTEKFPLHGFTTSCLMKPMNNIVTADRSNYTEEKFGWAFFHAGVSAGLSISRQAEGIDTSWIMFNKPAELTNKHAGLLLGLGLTGHLRTIAKWLSFKYLTPKHTMTSVGLLLGLSASYLGTMDTLVTRLLSVHVTRMLPPGAAELNLSPYTQTTGLLGIGLLYCSTQHRRMSEVMLSEIRHVELPDPSEPPETLRDESYRLAAGFSLGLINLGKGKDLKGLYDMRIVENLLTIAVGPKRVDLVHILDQATAGATIAIALIFMKTMNQAVAQKIDVPDTVQQFDYVRPDIFLLRTVAKHLIMWDDIKAEHQWMINHLPEEYREDHQLKNTKQLRSEHMPFYNIVAGLIWSISLRYAGSREPRVRDFIVGYLDQFIRLCRLPAIRYDAKLTRNCLRNCQDLVALAAVTVMAGTGDLIIFRRLRSLHSRAGSDVPYGSHFATHLALGALFLGGGQFTFSTSNLSIAALMCAFYPLFPTDVLDNRAHLQAFRHLWVLAAEPRCIVVRDVDTRRPVSMSITVTLHDGTAKQLVAPCLLPEVDNIATIRTDSFEYWQITLDLANNPTHLSTFQSSRTIHVRRRAAHEAHSSTFSASLVALNDAQASHTARLMWDWIFTLPWFSDFDHAAVGLIIPPDPISSVHLDMAGTLVDDRLLLKGAVRSGQRDRLWDLRVLFEWAERVQGQGGRLRWLGHEVIERLKAEVMEKMRVAQLGNHHQ